NKFPFYSFYCASAKIHFTETHRRQYRRRFPPAMAFFGKVSRSSSSRNPCCYPSCFLRACFLTISMIFLAQCSARRKNRRMLWTKSLKQTGYPSMPSVQISMNYRKPFELGSTRYLVEFVPLFVALT